MDPYPKRLKLSVTKGDITAARHYSSERGDSLNAEACPISWSAKREFPTSCVCTLYHWMVIGNHRFNLSLAAQRWIARHDRTLWKQAKPFAFIATRVG